MIKAIRADKEYRTAQKGREIIDFQERWGYVPSRSNRNKNDPNKPIVDYKNLGEALQEMNISVDDT